MAAKTQEIPPENLRYAQSGAVEIRIHEDSEGSVTYETVASLEARVENQAAEIRRIARALQTEETRRRVTDVRLRVAQVQVEAWKDASEAWREAWHYAAEGRSPFHQIEEKAKSRQTKAECAARVSLVPPADDLDRPKDGRQG